MFCLSWVRKKFRNTKSAQSSFSHFDIWKPFYTPLTHKEKNSSRSSVMLCNELSLWFYSLMDILALLDLFCISSGLSMLDKGSFHFKLSFKRWGLLGALKSRISVRTEEQHPVPYSSLLGELSSWFTSQSWAEAVIRGAFELQGWLGSGQLD